MVSLNLHDHKLGILIMVVLGRSLYNYQCVFKKLFIKFAVPMGY